MAIAILFLLGVGVGLALLISLTNLSSRVRQMAEELEHLKKRTANLEGGSAAQAVAWSDSPPPQQPEAPPAREAEPAAAPAETRPDERALPVPGKPARTKEEWEALIGGKVLNRIGALALIIGIAYFLKFAFDRNWITETFRVLIGVAAGCISLFVAARTHRKGFQIFAQGLVGAGIAILYLSVYASFNYYALVSQPVAFLLMSVVTVVAFAQALRYDAPAVSLLGLVGGFITPILLSTGETNLVGLFSYITILDLGILLVVRKKDTWMGLEPLAMIGTYIIFALWKVNQYTRADLLPATAFLSLFWLLFHLLDLRHLRGGSGQWAQERRVLAVFNGIVFYVFLSALLHDETPEWKAFGAALLGIAYAASLPACRGSEKRREAARVHFTLAAVFLLVLATGIECTGLTLPALWACESLALVWMGVRFRQKHLWIPGLLLSCIAWLTLLFTRGALFCQSPETFVPLINSRVLAFGLVMGTILAATALIRTVATRSAKAIEEALHYAWGILLFILATVEVNDWFYSIGRDVAGNLPLHAALLRTLTVAVAWVAVATLMSVAGLRRKIRPLVYMPFGALFAASFLGCTAGFTYQPIEYFFPVWNARAGALALAFAGTLLHLLWFSRSKEMFPWLTHAATALQVLAAGVALFLLSVETRDIFQQQIAALAGASTFESRWSDLDRLENLKQLSLSGLWLLYSVALMALGLVRRRRLLRLEAIGLFGFAILKIFIYDLSFLETLYRIFSFVGLGVILLLVSYLYQRYKNIILEPTPGE